MDEDGSCINRLDLLLSLGVCMGTGLVLVVGSDPASWTTLLYHQAGVVVVLFRRGSSQPCSFATRPPWEIAP